ncbi:MAG: glycosyltransferase [Fibrobacter sp.]|nr:glycosyltransferase [Fibrobacter sp.]
MNSLVSIIIPVYNVERFIKKCIDSVINQTYKNIEIFLIDDGSTDNSGKICDDYSQNDSRIKVFHKKNGGASSARNIGISVAKGDFIAYIDADDHVAIDYIENLLQFDADVVASNEKLEGLFSIDFVKKNFHNTKAFIAPYAKLYKRCKVSKIKFKEDLPIGEDRIYNLEILQNIQNVYLTKYQGYFINETNSASLTRGLAGHYSKIWDEEYQTQWISTLHKFLNDAQISIKESNNTAVIFYYKIRNLCYKDCPYTFFEKKQRIKTICQRHKAKILSTKNPCSKKLHMMAKFLVAIDSPSFTYIFFKTLLYFKVLV